jgi:hypothetical protein
MRKTFLLLFIGFIINYCSAQEVLNYKNITISFPDKYITKEVKGVKVFFLNKDSVSYQTLAIQDTSFLAKDEKELSKYLEGFAGGFIESTGTDFKKIITDTSIGGVKGKYLHLYEPAQHHIFKEAFAFLTIISNQPFTILVMPYGQVGDESRKRMSDFFRSVKFEGKQF